MAKGNHLGELEQTVLLALRRVDGSASGRRVYREIVDQTGRDIAVAAVHVTLTRLVGKGLVDAEMAPGPEGVGRDVRYFSLTAVGRDAVVEARQYWDRLFRDLPVQRKGVRR